MNSQEAAQALGTSQRTLQRFLEQGTIRGLRVGRQWRFRRADLEAYLNRETPSLELPTEEEVARIPQLVPGGEASAAGPLILPDVGEAAGGGLVPPPIVRMVGAVLTDALSRGASDLHVGSQSNGVSVRLRVDGVLQETLRLPAGFRDTVLACLKQMAGLNPGERRLPQEGRFNARLGDAEYTLRVSVAPALHGENLVARILARGNLLIGLNRLGFYPETLAGLDRLLSQPNGLVLAAGPTGSGKTTTMYSALNHISSPERNIITVEDPVEFALPHVVQMGVAARHGLTFAVLLRTCMRQDPDVVMVGELRDLESATPAIQIALTGHLVLASVWANDAATALTTLAEMGVPRFLLASTTRGVLAQRLARKLCEACKAPAQVEPALLEHAREQAAAGGWDLPGETVFLGPVGCDACRRAGYRGRIGLFELLEVDSAIRAALLDHAPEEEIRSLAVSGGMRSLAADGLRKAAQGITSLEEVLRVLAV